MIWLHDQIKQVYIHITVSYKQYSDKELICIKRVRRCNVTIASVTSTKNRTGDCMAKFKLQVSGLNDLNNAILNLKKIPEIYQIERVNK